MQYHPPFLYRMFSFVIIRLYNFFLPSDENHLIIPPNYLFASKLYYSTPPPPLIDLISHA